MGAAVSRVIGIRAVVSGGVIFRAEVSSGVEAAAVVGSGVDGVLVLQAQGLEDPGVHGQSISHFLSGAELRCDVPAGSFAVTPRERLAGSEPAGSSIIRVDPLPVPRPSAPGSRKQLLCEIKRTELQTQSVEKYGSSNSERIK